MGVSLPVYVLFNRSDRIPYFEEFAGTFNNEETSQVLGCTLPLVGSTSSGFYAEQETKRLTAAFQAIFFTLAECRPGLLSRERNSDRQAGVYEFPREFGKLSKPLVQFLVDLCRPGHLRTGPFLRGFYFVGRGSSPSRRTQAKRCSANARRTRSRRLQSGRNEFDQCSGFLCQDLLVHWYVPQRRERSAQVRPTRFSEPRLQPRLTARSRRARCQRHEPRWIGPPRSVRVHRHPGRYLDGRHAHFFVGNARMVSSVRGAAQELATVQNLGTQQPTLNALKLDSLRQTLVQLRDYKQNGAPLHLRWGLYAGNDIFEEARAIYFHAFDQVLFQHSKHNLLADLRTYQAILYRRQIPRGL